MTPPFKLLLSAGDAEATSLVGLDRLSGLSVRTEHPYIAELRCAVDEKPSVHARALFERELEHAGLAR